MISLVMFYIIDAINKAQRKISKLNNVLVNFNPNPFAPTDDLKKKKKNSASYSTVVFNRCYSIVCYGDF